MATTAYIIAPRGPNSYQAIYVHFDGYPTGLGKTLQDHWTDPIKVQDLINHGDCRTLGDSLETSEFFHRDFGDDFKVREFASLCRFLDHAKENYLVDYIYVLLSEKEWFYTFVGNIEMREFQSLKRPDYTFKIIP